MKGWIDMEIDYEKIKDNVVSTSKEIGAKAKETAEIAKIRFDIKAKERELNQLYAALGRVYYAAHQGEDGIPEEVMFHGIQMAEAELTGLKVNLDSHKNAKS